MVLVLPKVKSFGEEIGTAAGTGLGKGVGSFLEYKELQKKQQAENDTYEKLTGRDDLKGVTDPETRKMIYKYGLEGKSKLDETADELKGNRKLIAGIEKQRGLKPGSLAEFENDPALAEKTTKAEKQKNPVGGLGGIPLTPEESLAIQNVVKNNPKASAEELELEFNKAKIKPGSVTQILESRRRSEEHQTKSAEEKERTLRNETLPIRTELANKANAARQGIQNKLRSKEIIKRGDINDPTYAAAAEILPFNLGKRLLSNDTVEYKAGLVDDFKDLSTIFKGATRVKEVEIYEDKIADIYLTDAQKEAILDARINALKADVIRGEVAAELEKEGKFYGALNFEEEVNKRAQPKLDALFNQIWDETRNTINEAENKKKVPLDPKDPDDLKIMQQIKKEAGGDSAKALKLANKKGYKFT